MHTYRQTDTQRYRDTQAYAECVHISCQVTNSNVKLENSDECQTHYQMTGSI